MMTREMWLDPTPEMLQDPLFNKIWETIKTWDINVPAIYAGYCGATGNHARAIYDAIYAHMTPMLNLLKTASDYLETANNIILEDGGDEGDFDDASELIEEIRVAIKSRD